MDRFFKSWINFDEMITPKIIVIVYWVLLTVTVISSVMAMFGHVIIGILALVFGVIGVRVGCELVIISFNIYKCVKKIADNVDAPKRQHVITSENERI